MKRRLFLAALALVILAVIVPPIVVGTFSPRTDLRRWTPPLDWVETLEPEGV